MPAHPAEISIRIKSAGEKSSKGTVVNPMNPLGGGGGGGVEVRNLKDKKRKKLPLLGTVRRKRGCTGSKVRSEGKKGGAYVRRFRALPTSANPAGSRSSPSRKMRKSFLGDPPKGRKRSRKGRPAYLFVVGRSGPDAVPP